MKPRVLLAFLVFAACTDNTSVTPSPEIPEPPENPGTALVYVGNVQNDCLAWSASTNEIIWNAPGGLKAVQYSTGRVRDLDPRPGCRDLQLSEDGEYAYYLLFSNSNAVAIGGRIHRCQIVSGLHEQIDSAEVWSYCVSPVGARVAYSRPDSLCVSDAETHVARGVVAGGIAHCFSPDGERLLCNLADSFFVLTLSTGEREPVPGLDSRRSALRWDSYGIRYVVSYWIYWGGQFIYEFRNVSTGSFTIVSFGSYFLHSWSLTDYRWSRDGNRFALWRDRCIRPAPDENCDLAGYGLYVLDLQSQSARLTACIKTSNSADDVLGDIAFSPEGSSVAYICDGYIRVAAVSERR